MTFEEWAKNYFAKLPAWQDTRTEYTVAKAAWEAAQPKWQPIETAPKDRLVDIWIEHRDGGGVRWCSCYYDKICDEWRTSRPSGHLLSIKARNVSHWMPIPQAPQEVIKMTLEQKQTLKEYDQQQKELEQQLKALLERRREYINRNQLNEKVGVK